MSHAVTSDLGSSAYSQRPFCEGYFRANATVCEKEHVWTEFIRYEARLMACTLPPSAAAAAAASAAAVAAAADAVVLGGAVQVDSIKTCVDSGYGFRA